MASKKSADVLAAVLTAVAWFWTARECDMIGIDVFDAILLKQRTGGLFVWVLAAVLTVLTFLWMRPHLITRAIMAIFMLAPASVFRFTRLMLPDHGFAPVQLLVGFMYVLAVIGMYGMFYPWKIERVFGIGDGRERKAGGEGAAAA
ncbi:MAG: hypothetical protein IJ829_04320 [Kiritimatiellae bacterium]|nr:hypothetical protein [Kiritimatiellia bacterium]